MSTQANYLSYKSGVNAVTDKEPVDYVQLAFKTRLYLEVALRALDKIASTVVTAGEACDIAKKAMADIDAVKYEKTEVSRG